MPSVNTTNKGNPYSDTVSSFVSNVKSAFKGLNGEITERNTRISNRDSYIYGDMLERSLDIPLGHDFTPVNWLRRGVEIHKNMFMSRGFQVVSTYDLEDVDNTNAQDMQRKEIENNKEKTYAEARQNLIKSIIEDNGGDAFWSVLAENASAVGDSAIKAYWNEKDGKYELCQIESIENLYALWSRDDFRKVDAYAYVYQVSKQEAIDSYGAPQNVVTSPLGSPLDVLSSANTQQPNIVGTPMVTILEVTGKVEGWAAEKGRVKKVKVGEETELNALIIGSSLTRLITEPKKLPKYYILPNKRQRRRPWGLSDISDSAININQTYIETLSDWRTASAKINFPKFKAFGFGPDTQMPKPESRKVQYLPLAEGQDIQELGASQTDGIDWARQLDECKEQFVRETGLSRVLFDDPSVTLNSNQALLTSMKPTSDIAEAKKQLWAPIIINIFKDALETIALNKPEFKDLADTESNWTLRVMWPSVMQKEDPVYQSMLLNRFNAGLMSAQSYMEAQGDTKEEIDRIRSEMIDPITSAMLGKQLPVIAQTIIQAATVEIQTWVQSMMPQSVEQEGQATGQPGINPNGGGAATTPIGTPADNVAGIMSQPGTGATATSPQGALAQTVQNQGG